MVSVSPTTTTMTMQPLYYCRHVIKDILVPLLLTIGQQSANYSLPSRIAVKGAPSSSCNRISFSAMIWFVRLQQKSEENSKEMKCHVFAKKDPKHTKG